MLQLIRGTLTYYSCYCKKLLIRIQGSLASKIRYIVYKFLNSAWGEEGAGVGVVWIE